MSSKGYQVEVILVKDLPTNEINEYMDKIVYGIARTTLDLTNTGHHFPYLTGELNRASMAEGVVKESYGNYHLGANGVDYAPKVWNYGSNTNWTNASTYPQWFITEFKRDKNIIVESAIKQALGGLK